MARTTSTKHLKLKDELVELERYLVSFKESSQRSLQAIREGDARSAPNGSAADVSHTKLEAEIERLRKENSVLQNQLKSSAGDAANGDAVNALRAKCARLESELAAARTAAMAQQPRGAPSTSGSPPPAGSTPAANPDVLRKMQQDIAQLRQDREGLEDQVVNMYEDLFKDEIITGIVGLIRRKEVELAAQIDTAGSGAGRKNGAGKPVPRLKQKLDEATVKMEKLEKELKAKASEMDAAERHHQDMLKIATLEANAQAEHYKASWKKELERRKLLHQKVLELKGAIRVFCRVRPLQPADGDTVSSIVVKDQESLIINIPHAIEERRRAASAPLNASSRASPPVKIVGRDFFMLDVPVVNTRSEELIPARYEFDHVFAPKDIQKAVNVSDLIVSVADSHNVCVIACCQTGSGVRDTRYEFDRVFAPNDSQEAVYEDVSDLIVSVADGYNVCIMAYGQTGSGKTYTMQGESSNPGINMRALKELFQIGEDRKESVRMQVQASIVEIYNESIFDLLSDSPRHTGDRLDIKEVGGHIWIPNLSMLRVSSVADVDRLIRKGDTGRSTFATDMNEHSSRSHLILSLYVRTENFVSGEKTASKLHLIDLAGSERLSRSNAEGDRLTEARNINASLASLGDVIQSLKAHSAHVPYRNCKLTRLLSDSLGGKSKTLLVVNLSPTRESAAESRCSCEFASRAKKVELGRAVRNVDTVMEKQGSLPVRPASMGAGNRPRRTLNMPELSRNRGSR